MKEKVTYHQDPKRAVYDQDHWDLLQNLRSEALKVIEDLPFQSYVYGSIARGDVHPGSDIDIILFENIPSYQLELSIDYVSREIVQATPNALIKAHIHVNDRAVITFPMVAMNDIEQDFYRFSGCLDTQRITGRTGDRDRVPGISKRLLLIEPTEDGHIERSLLDDLHGSTKKLGISADIIQERVRVLTRRDKVGRTGVFLKVDVREDESFEQRLQKIADRNNIVRRMLQQRGWS